MGPTERAMRAAHQEAIGFAHDYVGTEHILLGLIRDATVEATLGGLGVSPDDVRARIEESVRRGTSRQSPGELPFTSRATNVLRFALEEARRASDPEVKPAHVLLALLREDKGIACEVLNQLGVTEERVRSKAAE